MRPPAAAHLAPDFDLRVYPRPRAAGSSGGARGVGSGFPWLRLCLGCSAVVTVLAYSAERHHLPSVHPLREPVELSPASAPAPIWTPIARPLAIYGIGAPHLRGLPFTLTARRDATGAREDALTFGSFAHEAEPTLHVVLHRSPEPEALEASLFLDLARRAARTGGLAVIRSASSEGLATKFGLVETSEVTLSNVAERTCTGFRFAHSEVGFSAIGWLCPASGQNIDQQELACTIDGLSLVEAGNDEQLKSLFAQADRQRTGGCAPIPPVAATPPTLQTRSASRSPRRARPAQSQRAVAASRKDAPARRPTRRADAASGSRG